MRVCVLIYAFYETDGRAIRYTELLAARGVHVDVIAIREPGTKPYEIVNGVHVYRIQERIINEKNKLSYASRILRFLFHSAWFLTKLQMRGRYDLIHVHSVPDFEVFAAIVPKYQGAKIILDIHDIVPEFYASKFSNHCRGLAFQFLLLIEKLSIRFSDHVIISNDLWKHKLESRSVRPEKCTSLLNYADGSVFFRRERKRTDESFMILYPGTLNWHQGLDIAINAFAKIRNKVPNAHFFIYGDGPEKTKLTELIESLQLIGRVTICPSIPWRNIAEVISNADLGIIPKRNDQFGGEAFSTKTLEFMSAGVPIIVSKTRIDQHYFDDTVVKFFEPENVDDLSNAIVCLVKNKENREKLANNGLNFAKKQSWGIKKNIYLELVDSLCRTQDSFASK
jgi:glycosyltransferase involved in cell wall biosynthesis